MNAVLASLLAGLVLQGKPPEADRLEHGLVGEYFHVGPPLKDFPAPEAAVQPRFKRVDKQIDFLRTSENFPGTKLKDGFFIRWTGLIRIPKTATYTFSTVSDDGSRLFIGGKAVVDNGGCHEMKEAQGKIELAEGDHEIRVEYFDDTGPSGIRLQWESDGIAKDVVPSKALFHKRSARPTEEERKGISLSPDAPVRPKESETFSGEIVKVEGVSLTFRRDGKEGREETVKVDKEARIQEGDRRLTLEELKPGREVRVVLRGGLAVRLELKRAREEPRKDPGPVPEGVDESVVGKDEPRPAHWGRVTAVFDDGGQMLLTVRTRTGELPFYLGADSKVTYVGIADKAGHKPATGYRVYLWLKPGSADAVAEARFAK